MSDPTGLDVKRRLRLAERLERLWLDERFDDNRRGEDLRGLAEAMIWGAFLRLENPAWGEFLMRTGHHRNWDGIYYLIGEDAPRYVPPDERYSSPCVVPLTRGKRAGQPCGKHPYMSERVTDPQTGQWHYEGFCNNHQAHRRATEIAERARTSAGSIPEPLPNIGGLLPSHIRRSDWPDLYQRAKSHWKPPTVGIIADQWPVLAKVEEQKPPKLVLLAGGGDPCGHDDLIDAARTLPNPGLALVPSGQHDDPKEKQWPTPD